MNKKEYNRIKKQQERIQKKIQKIDNQLKELENKKEELILDLDKNNLLISDQVFSILNIEPGKILDRLANGENIEQIIKEIVNRTSENTNM